MVCSPLGLLLHQLNGGVEGSILTERSDGQLLERFLMHHEEAAFADLLRRHGPMVLSICRRSLANEQDREDVFQATFLLLARKAGSIRRRESVGSWLHGVAHRLAVQCRRQEIRHRVHERQAGLERCAIAPASEAWESLGTLLDEAIAELPEKYRTALVVCYLEDHTHEEAARLLCCRLNTLRSRLARGRERLRTALIRRGLMLSSGAFLAALATRAAQAAVPVSLRIRTLAAAMQGIKGDAISTCVSASVAALVNDGLPALSTIKLKALLMLLLAAGLTLGGAGLLAQQILESKKSEQPPQSGGERAAAPPAGNRPKGAVDRFGDPLPERAIARLGTVRFRMGGLVGACAWSPDGKTLAGGSIDFFPQAIRLFDAATGQPTRQLHGHPYQIFCLTYSPDGRILASGSQAAIVLWDSITGKILRQFSCKPGQQIQVRSLAFTPDGKGLISAGEDARIRLWDSATGKEIRQFTGHTSDVRCAALSPDGRTLASAAGKEIRLWQTATGKLIGRLMGQKEPIRALAFSPDGKRLASGGDDRSTSSIWVWETATGKVYRRFPENATEARKRWQFLHDLRSIAFSPDGKTLAAGFGDYGLYLWDVAKGKSLHEMPGNGTVSFRSFHDGGIQSLIFSRDGKRLALARDNQLTLLDVLWGKEIQPLPAHRGALGRVFFRPDGKRLLTGSDEQKGRILEWDATSGELIRELPGKAEYTAHVSFSPDRKILASSGNGQTLVLWDTENGKEIRKFPLPLKQFHTPGDIVFSPDGKLLAVEEGEGKAVWLYDPATGKQVCTVEGMTTAAYPMSLTFSPDGRILAAADRKAILLAEVPSGRQLPSIAPPKERYAVAVTLSPDGRTLATPCTSFFEGGKMILWEIATGKVRLSFPEPPGEIHNVAFSPDGRLLAAGGFDNQIYLWDARNGERLSQFKGHQGNINSLVFSPDGRRLASSSHDTTALIWDVSGLAKKLPRRGPLSQKELDELWSTLAGEDAATAYQAILTLQSCPDQAVSLLTERLHLKPVDDKRITRLLALLDSGDFTEREQATKELRELGWTAESALHTAFSGKPSLEARQRIKALLDDIRKQPLPPEILRIVRGMEVLEHIGTPAARKVITSLTEGTPQARLPREAKAALQRLR